MRLFVEFELINIFLLILLIFIEIMGLEEFDIVYVCFFIVKVKLLFLFDLL